MTFSVPSQAGTAAERKLYRDAIAQIRAGNHRAFAKTAAQLEDYELHPYLEYHSLNSRLSGAGHTEVLKFLKDHESLPVHRHLKRRWLRRVGQQRQWSLFLSHYQDTGNAELNCYYLRSLYGTGEKELALNQTAAAWIKASSQPKACDPLFEVWRKTPNFNDDVIWQRLQLALAANEVTLARYLIRQFTNLGDIGQLFYDAHVRPTRLRSNSKYVRNSDRHRQIVQHALPRLARSEPDQAIAYWSKNKNKFGFSETEISALHQELAVKLADEGRFPPISERALVTDADRQEELQQSAAQQQAWEEVIYWSEQLPSPHLQKPNVQYWFARALQLSTGDTERARLAFMALAETRHYYGFWAAQHLGIPGQLTANPVYDQRNAIAQLRRLPRFSRSLELFAVGDDLNGRREWYAGLNEVPKLEQKVAAELALSAGLLPLTITTANHADARNALHLRFPTAYLPQLRRASLDTGLAVPTLMAITRQESAWDYQAVSSANAHGLMQLLPSTARLVARRFRLASPSRSDLHDPGKNINLGSRHLAWLMERYDHQLAPAAAAYNAGEHRADRWLRERDQLPLDIWIETIPFRETRNYVKNVLAFRHVYGQLTQSPLPFVRSSDLIVKAP